MISCWLDDGLGLCADGERAQFERWGLICLKSLVTSDDLASSLKDPEICLALALRLESKGFPYGPGTSAYHIGTFAWPGCFF